MDTLASEIDEKSEAEQQISSTGEAEKVQDRIEAKTIAVQNLSPYELLEIDIDKIRQTVDEMHNVTDQSVDHYKISDFDKDLNNFTTNYIDSCELTNRHFALDNQIEDIQRKNSKKGGIVSDVMEELLTAHLALIKLEQDLQKALDRSQVCNAQISTEIVKMAHRQALNFSTQAPRIDGCDLKFKGLYPSDSEVYGCTSFSQNELAKPPQAGGAETKSTIQEAMIGTPLVDYDKLEETIGDGSDHEDLFEEYFQAKVFK